MIITDEQKKILLTIARKSIQKLFIEIEIPEMDETDELLNSKAGVFVTLTKSGNLRGCIGFITSVNILKESVFEAAQLAATEDPRFQSVTLDELKNIAIEISVLSEPFNLDSYDDIIVGKHGLILIEGQSRGLLLPQVPIEHNLSKEEYLSALCNKAGLPRNYWKEKMLNLKGFTASIFSEKELGINL